MVFISNQYILHLKMKHHLLFPAHMKRRVCRILVDIHWLHGEVVPPATHPGQGLEGHRPALVDTGEHQNVAEVCGIAR